MTRRPKFSDEMSLQGALQYLKLRDTIEDKILLLSYLSENELQYKARDSLGNIVYGFFGFGGYEDGESLSPEDVVKQPDVEYEFLVKTDTAKTYLTHKVKLNRCIFSSLDLEEMNSSYVFTVPQVEFDEEKFHICKGSTHCKFSSLQYKAIKFLYEQAKINPEKFYANEDIFKVIDESDTRKFDWQMSRLFSDSKKKKDLLKFIEHHRPSSSYRFKRS
jgi:hypothetical protein